MVKAPYRHPPPSPKAQADKPAPSARQWSESERGFTVIAVVVIAVAVGALIAISAMSEQTTREGRLQTGTRADLTRIGDAIVAYAATYDRLPCTDTDGDGEENRTGGNCDDFTGVVPWVSLGLLKDQAFDRWGRVSLYRPFKSLADLTGSDTNRISVRYAQSPASGYGLDDGLALCDTFQAPCDAENQVIGPQAGGGDRPAASFVLISTGPSGEPAGSAEIANQYASDPVPAAYYDLPFNETPSNAADHFDDIVYGMSLQELMERAGLLKSGSPPGAPGTGLGPGTNYMTSSPQTGKNNGGAWSVQTKMFGASAQAPNGGTRTVSPQIGTDEDGNPQFEFRPIQDQINQDAGACLWSVMDMRMVESVTRSVFEVSFLPDGGNARGHGLTHAFLPLEVSGSFEGNNASARCGTEGIYLGFDSSVTGTGKRALVDQKTDFVSALSDYRDAMPFAVELDTSYQRGKNIANGHDFWDPLSSTGMNHVAVDIHNVFHDDSLPANSTKQNRDYPNPSCDGVSEACDWTSSDHNWLEKGPDAFHLVRVELEPGGGSCDATDEIEVRSWVWPAGTACAKDPACREVDSDYTVEDANAITAAYCVPRGGRSVDVGGGATLGALDRLRFGFTAGIPTYSGYSNANRSDPVVRKHTIASIRNWIERPDAPKATVSPLLDAALVSTDLNWDVIAKARAEGKKHAWTGTSWMPLPDYKVEISSFLGEITVITPNESGGLGNRWGFGVHGAGGNGRTDWSTFPPLSNIDDPTLRPLLPEMRNRLDFTFDERWKTAKVVLTGFGELNGVPERVRLQLWRVGPIPEKVGETVVGSCQDASGSGHSAAVQINLASKATFDTISVIPEPRENAASGSSAFWVRMLRGCGEDAGGACAIPISRMPDWWDTCQIDVSEEDLE